MLEYKSARFLFTLIIKLTDLFFIFIAWKLSWFLRFDFGILAIPKGIPSVGIYDAAIFPLLLSHTVTFHIVGAYRKERIVFGFRAIKKVLEGVVLGTLVFIASCFFEGFIPFSRIFLVISLFLVFFSILVGRTLFHLFWQWVQNSNITPISILLVGEGDLLSLYYSQLQSFRPYPIHWIGRVGPKNYHSKIDIKLNNKMHEENIPWLGEEEKLLEVIEKEKPNYAVVSYSNDQLHRLPGILDQLSNQLLNIKILPDFGRYSTFTYMAEHECGIPLLSVNSTRLGISDRAIKRVLDFIFSSLVLVFGFPVFLLIGILIKLTSRGPILYSQIRVGANGKIFTLYKFRSMCINAEDETGAVWAKEQDARTTSFGKWLRKTSFDELPQFFNVLCGDMSLVGPRPERPIFVEKFRYQIPKYMLRHGMRSGITGWAQVNGWRGNTSLEERLKHDLYYIGNWSHRFDFKILILTLFRGFVHKNAY